MFKFPTNQGEAESPHSEANSHLSSWCALNERTARKEGILCCVIVNDYCLYMARRSISFVLPSASAAAWNSFMASETRKELNSAKMESKKKRGEKKGYQYRYFHPEKWNIKRVHYTLNLQLFLIAHGHFPIFPALLLALRSGPWEKSPFYYLNPCMGGWARRIASRLLASSLILIGSLTRTQRME